MAAAPDDTRIVDVPSESRYTYHEDGRTAELIYRRNGDRLVLLHTGVPDELGGRGIGGRLVRAAIGRAAAEHLTIVPVCPFVRRWLKEHPDEAGGVEVDWHA
jgi:uncharacterized protein